MKKNIHCVQKKALLEKSCGNCGYDDCVGLKKPCGGWIPIGIGKK